MTKVFLGNPANWSDRDYRWIQSHLSHGGICDMVSVFSGSKFLLCECGQMLELSSQTSSIQQETTPCQTSPEW